MTHAVEEVRNAMADAILEAIAGQRPVDTWSASVVTAGPG